MITSLGRWPPHQHMTKVSDTPTDTQDSFDHHQYQDHMHCGQLSTFNFIPALLYYCILRHPSLGEYFTSFVNMLIAFLCQKVFVTAAHFEVCFGNKDYVEIESYSLYKRLVLICVWLRITSVSCSSTIFFSYLWKNFYTELSVFFNNDGCNE